MLPSFLVIGAQKSGTTSLHNWLSQQPEVCLPLHKETQFFAKRFNQGLDWYRSQFPCARPGALVGEVDPEYLYDPEVPERIAAILGSPRLVAVLREPVSRAYSQYRMSVARGFETLPFAEALAREAERLVGADAAFARAHFSYMARGHYTEQLKRYTDVFGEAALLLVAFEDLTSRERGGATYATICEHVGVTSDPALADRSGHSNPASEPRSAALQKVLYGHGWLRRWGGKLLPTRSLRMATMRMLRSLNERDAPPAEAVLWQSAVPNWVWVEAQEEYKALTQQFGDLGLSWETEYRSRTRMQS